MIVFLLTLPLLAEIADDERRHRLGPAALSARRCRLAHLLSKISVGAILVSAVGFAVAANGYDVLGPDQAGCSAPPDCDTRHRDPISRGHILLQALDPFGFLREYPRGALSNIAANVVLLGVAFQVWRERYAKGQEVCRSGCRYCDRGHRRALLINVPGAADYYFVNVGTWTAIVFVWAYGGAFLERIFSSPLASGISGCGDPAGCACDERKKKKRVPAGRVVRGAPGDGSGWLRRKRRRGDNDPSTPCRTSDTGTSGPLRAGERHEAYAGSAGQRDIAGNGNHGGAIVRRYSYRPTTWPSGKSPVECRADPFFVPAILGAPMLKGLNPPALKCPREPYYGFADYKDAKLRTIERPATLRPGGTLENRYGIDTRDARHRPKNSLRLRPSSGSLCSQGSGRLPADREQLCRRSYQGLADPIPNRALTCGLEGRLDPTFGYRHQPG